ncbi:MAG: DUF1499 domain-containing protein [Desulfuromonadales bacterium]|nr:DUF1499 domain-containing protein [Desulfuromonadales bacterium]
MRDEERRHYVLIKSRGVLVMSILSTILAACAGERPNNLGVRDNGLTACPNSPNCVSSRAQDEKHRIAPLSFNGNPDAAFARLKQYLSRRSDTTIIAESPGYLRVELNTTLFVDDGEFLLDKVGRVIHVRSAARLGYYDLGKNRSRMEDIRKKYTEEETRP